MSRTGLAEQRGGKVEFAEPAEQDPDIRVISYRIPTAACIREQSCSEKDSPWRFTDGRVMLAKSIQANIRASVNAGVHVSDVSCGSALPHRAINVSRRPRPTSCVRYNLAFLSGERSFELPLYRLCE